MSNIKTSDPNMNLKPVELTPSELNSVVGGDAQVNLNNLFATLAAIYAQQGGGGRGFRG
jgi:hypothetical protein